MARRALACLRPHTLMHVWQKLFDKGPSAASRTAGPVYCPSQAITSTPGPSTCGVVYSASARRRRSVPPGVELGLNRAISNQLPIRALFRSPFPGHSCRENSHASLRKAYVLGKSGRWYAGLSSAVTYPQRISFQRAIDSPYSLLKPPRCRWGVEYSPWPPNLITLRGSCLWKTMPPIGAATKPPGSWLPPPAVFIQIRSSPLPYHQQRRYGASNSRPHFFYYYVPSQWDLSSLLSRWANRPWCSSHLGL